jgi:hypothetical protein
MMTMARTPGLVWIMTLFLYVMLCITSLEGKIVQSEFRQLLADNGQPFESFFNVPPSVDKWENIENLLHFSVLSMSVEHNSESKWFLPHLHARDSIGYNRTHVQRQYGNRPHACSIQFYGIGLESNLAGYQTGGTGYMTIAFKDEHKKQYWHGFDKNETNRLHCYYATNKDTGSEFVVSCCFLLFVCCGGGGGGGCCCCYCGLGDGDFAVLSFIVVIIV